MNGAGSGDAPARRIGRLPNFVQVAKSYVFEQQIQKSLHDTGVSQAREDSIRLAGVQWIDNVRRALKLPVKTFNTAVVYYHKFGLQDRRHIKKITRHPLRLTQSQGPSP